MLETKENRTPHVKEVTSQPQERVVRVTDAFLNELEAVRQTFSDIAQTNIAHKVFASPKWMMRVLGMFHPTLLLGRKVPLATCFKNSWIDFPEQVVSFAQAAVLEFVHESQPVLNDTVSIRNVVDIYRQRLADLIFQEKELHEMGHGPVASTLRQALTTSQNNSPTALRQTLAEIEFFIPDDTGAYQTSNFSRLLQPVFAIDPIRERVIDILSDDLALA